MMVRARVVLVQTRTALINAARGITKLFGERLPSCRTKQIGRDQAESLSPALQAALEPLLAEAEKAARWAAMWDCDRSADSRVKVDRN